MKFRLTRQNLASALSNIGFSRHAAVPVLRAAAPAFRRAGDSTVASFAKQLVSMVTGASLIGVAVAMLVQADLGLTPYDVMLSAVSQQLGITLGQAGWLAAGVLLSIATVLGRRPSPWGLAYIFTIGLTVDGASGLLTQPETLAGRWMFVFAAIVVLASGVNLVVYSGTTGGPFELLMNAGQDRGVNRIAVRYGLDVGAFALGVILGGSFGPATIVLALAFGLALKVIGQALVDHGEGRRLRLEQDANPEDEAATPVNGSVAASLPGPIEFFDTGLDGSSSGEPTLDNPVLLLADGARHPSERRATTTST